MNSRNYYDGPQINPAEIAEKIVNIGKQAALAGVQKINIATIIKPIFEKGRIEVESVNALLKQYCRQEGFNIIDLAHIEREDMGDAIHVNWHSGTHKLMNGIFSQLYTYKRLPQQRRDRG